MTKVHSETPRNTLPDGISRPQRLEKPVVPGPLSQHRVECCGAQIASELGHELPRCGQNAASALPPEAAATVAERCVRFGPIGVSAGPISMPTPRGRSFKRRESNLRSGLIARGTLPVSDLTTPDRRRRELESYRRPVLQRWPKLRSRALGEPSSPTSVLISPSYVEVLP
jgi:hypothetical protein